MMRDTRLWTWHLLAGIAILVLLGLHMAMMHMNILLGLVGYNPAGEDPLLWQNVVFRARQVGFLIIYIALLGAALYHGLYGLRNILYELDPSPGIRRFLGVAILVVGIVLMAVGTWAAIAARTTALAAGL